MYAAWLKRAGCSGLLLGLASAAMAQTQQISFQGRATDLHSHKLLYTEEHRIVGACQNGDWKPTQETVTYRAPDHKVLAIKHLDYSSGLQTPSFTMTDKVFHEHFDIRYRAGQPVDVRWRDTQGTNHQEKVPSSPRLVIDGGFDYTVKAHWSSLLAGTAMPFDFLAPTRGKTIAFRLVPADADQRRKTGAEHSFVIKPQSTFLSWFVDPILLGYNAQQQLTDYIGVTNIPRTPNDNYRAHIHYQHSPPPHCD